MLKARKINSVSLIHLSVINSTLTFSSEYRIQKVNVRTLYAPLIDKSGIESGVAGIPTFFVNGNVMGFTGFRYVF
jgi:hypothetical protein